MPVEVRLPETFRRYADGEACVFLPPGTVEAILGQLCSRHPAISERLLGIDGTLMGHLAVIQDGTLLPTASHGEVTALEGQALEILFVASGG